MISFLCRTIPAPIQASTSRCSTRPLAAAFAPPPIKLSPVSYQLPHQCVGAIPVELTRSITSPLLPNCQWQCITVTLISDSTWPVPNAATPVPRPCLGALRIVGFYPSRSFISAPHRTKYFCIFASYLRRTSHSMTDSLVTSQVIFQKLNGRDSQSSSGPTSHGLVGIMLRDCSSVYL
jgi:hypothetical protein